MSKRTILVLAFGSMLALLVGVGVAFAASLPGSNFEIDTSANLKVDGAVPPSLDWANVDETRKTDKPTGQTDDSFGNGTKEDTAVPSVIDGSIPNNKSDLRNFGAYLETTASGARYLNVFWHRVQEPSGTTNMDFEFNQSSTTSSNNVTPSRTAGDVLIQYDLAQGGTNPQLFLSRWVTQASATADPAVPDSPAQACEASNAFPCWGDRINLSAAGDATGSINTTAIAATDADGLGAISPRTFGEAQIDFDALTGGSTSCVSFGSAYLKSRSSDSFTAALKDFIAPVGTNIGNCAKVTIRKETNPDENPNATNFGFTKTFPTGTASANTFQLQDDGAKSYSDVKQGNNYVVDEDVIPAGWDLQNIDCNVAGHPSSGVTPAIDVAAGTVTFSIDSASDVLDCTYTNRSPGKIIVKKETTPDGSTQSFPFTLTRGGTDVIPGFSLKDGESKDSGALLPQSGYDVTENVPAGWDLSSVQCDQGETNEHNITVDPGQTVTCTFNNSQKTTSLSTSQSLRPQDTATIGGSGSGTFNGQVDFKLYQGACDTGTLVYSENNVSLDGSNTAKTNNTTYTISGNGTSTYHWKVSYHNDTNGHPDASSCVEEHTVTINNDTSTP